LATASGDSPSLIKMVSWLPSPISIETFMSSLISYCYEELVPCPIEDKSVEPATPGLALMREAPSSILVLG
jgi:hypothetical protein